MKHYLTIERLKELKIELERLKKDARLEIAERLKHAKELGDLSENSEYSDAKDTQAKVESRIFELEDILRNTSIIKKKVGQEIVHIGSTIEIKRDGKRFTYTIVGSQEARPEANLVSNESPLGNAFLDKKAGDTVEIQTPNGIVKCEIIKIS
ncbi:MAG TPA: transcription elongation factor GreA [Candidatus Wolfebacteria bacterium]|nr:transcription elongation factor GreA [Candidatus Wolfebacteria bacterium]